MVKPNNGMQPSGKARDFDSRIPQVRTLPSQPVLQDKRRCSGMIIVIRFRFLLVCCCLLYVIVLTAAKIYRENVTLQAPFLASGVDSGLPFWTSGFK